MHRRTPAPLITSSTDIQGRQLIPMHDSDEPHDAQAVKAASQAQSDEADLLALLRRLGLALSPPTRTVGRNGHGASDNGHSGGGGGGGGSGAVSGTSGKPSSADRSSVLGGDEVGSTSVASNGAGRAKVPREDPQRADSAEQRAGQRAVRNMTENGPFALARDRDCGEARPAAATSGAPVGRGRNSGNNETMRSTDAFGRPALPAGSPPPPPLLPDGQARAMGLGTTAAASDGMVDLMRREITAHEASLLGPILRAATGVTCLKLCYNHFRDGGAEAVSGAIERHPSLHTMDLGFNGIADQGAASLARSLERNRSLRTLYLSGNSIGVAGAKALATALARNDGLATLHLSGNCIGPDGASALAEALKSNTSLTRLYIDGAGIKARGACSVAAALVTNNVLSDLHMSDNEIGDKGLEGLAEALRRNKSVRLLELCFNRITAAGAEFLAKAVWGCKTLRALRLDNNQVGDRGAQALATALPTLGLETLEIGFNNVATVGVAALMQAIVNSPTFTSLSLSGNVLDAEAAKAIQVALSQPRCALRRLSLEHTSLGRASEGFIANGVLSNRCLALVTLTGFRLGAAFARLGMPPQVAKFSNEQALEQVRLYWANQLSVSHRSEREGDRAGGTEPTAPGQASGRANGNGRGTRNSAPGDQRAAYQQQQQQQHAHYGLQGTAASVHPSSADGVRGGAAGNMPVPPATMKACRLVAGTGGHIREEQAAAPPLTVKDYRTGGGSGFSGDKPDSQLVNALHDIAQLPFSAAELWSLHQYYFSPPVEPRSPASTAAPSPGSSAPAVPAPAATPTAGGGGGGAATVAGTPSPSATAIPAAANECAVGWLDTFCGGSGSDRGRDESDAGAAIPAVGGAGRSIPSAATPAPAKADGGGAGDEGLGAGARRNRRASSIGEEEDDELDSPRPPSKRYRNSFTKTRIACFPAVQARIRTLKSKPDERGVLTLLRQLKFLEAGGREDIYGTPSKYAAPAQGSAAPGGVFDAADASGTASGDPKRSTHPLLTDAGIEKLLLEEL